MCASVNFCFCLCLCVHACVSFCLAPATANSSERPADRCSRRGFARLSKHLFLLFSLFGGVGGFIFFPLSLSFGEG